MSTLQNFLVSLFIVPLFVVISAANVCELDACASDFFVPKTPIATGSGTRSVAFADFNRDGIRDVITTGGPNQVRVFLGNGIDGYGPPISTTVGTSPYQVVTADFNRDRKADFAVTNLADGSVTVGFGNGDGTFQTITLATGSFVAEGIAVGFINGDRYADIAVTVRGTGSPNLVKIYYGNGAGFTNDLNLDFGMDPVSVALSDLSRSGRLDLIVGREDPTPGTGRVAIRYNNGVGFGAMVQFPVGDSPIDLSVGDLNNDQYPDIATANFDGRSATILLANTGDDLGTYTRTDLERTSPVTSVSIGDINQDGNGDLAVGMGGTVTVYLGQGDAGIFTEAATVNVGGTVSGIGLSDHNLNGRPDLVVVNSSEVRILENTCPRFTGALTKFKSNTLLGISTPKDLKPLYDTSKCGLDDLKCKSSEEKVGVISSDKVTLVGTEIKKTIEIESPKGIAPVKESVPSIDTSPSPTPAPVVIAPTYVVSSTPSLRRRGQADGKGDEGSSNRSGLEDDDKLKLSYYRMNADGEYDEMVAKEFEATWDSEENWDQEGFLAYGDANNDGETDFLLTSFSNDMVYIETVVGAETDDPTIQSIRAVQVGDKPIDIVVGDFNKDGFDDFATANSGDNTISVCLNTASGTTCTTIALSSVPTSLAAEDMNLDGHIDLVVGTEGGIRLYFGNGNGGFASVKLIDTTDSKILKVTTGDVNVDGKSDIIAITEKVETGEKSVEVNFTKLSTVGTLDYQSLRLPKKPVANDTKALLVSKLTKDVQPDLMLAKSSLNSVEILEGTRLPVGSSDTYDVTFGETRSVAAPGILENDSDPDCLTISAVLVSGPAHSAGFNLNSDGSFTYIPGSTYTATDSFVYKISNGSVESEDVTVTLNVIDATPPVITPSVTGTVGNNEWYTSDVEIAWTVSDPESGVSEQTGCSTLIQSTDTAEGTFTCEATNGSGFAASGSVVIKRDATAPSLSPVVDPNPVILHQQATASPNATDAMSGLASQSCGTPLTSSIGPKTVSCTATDLAGNVSEVEATYNVIYQWSGFLDPIGNLPVMNVVKGGQVVPLKFSLAGYQGMAVISPGFPVVSTVSCAANSPTSEVEETSSPGNSALTYDAAADVYKYNWKTNKTVRGTCQILTIKLADGTLHYAKFSFK